MSVEHHGPALAASPFRAYGPSEPKRYFAHSPTGQVGVTEVRIVVACNELAARCAIAQAGWDFSHQAWAMPTSELLVNIVNGFSVPLIDLVVLP